MNTKAILHRMHDTIDSVEKVIWILEGAKRCSYAPEGIEQFSDELDHLGIKLEQWWVASREWPDQTYFMKRFPSKKYSADRAAGLFLDIPYCCAEAFQNDQDAYCEQLLRAFPFRNRHPNETDAEYIAAFSEHDKLHQSADRSGIIHDETNALVLDGKLPPSMFLMLESYTPCTPECRRFRAQAARMYRALERHLPRETESILQEYKERAFSWA